MTLPIDADGRRVPSLPISPGIAPEGRGVQAGTAASPVVPVPSRDGEPHLPVATTLLELLWEARVYVPSLTALAGRIDDALPVSFSLTKQGRIVEILAALQEWAASKPDRQDTTHEQRLRMALYEYARSLGPAEFSGLMVCRICGADSRAAICKRCATEDVAVSDLIAALRAYMEPAGDTPQQLREQARAAIAKAEGRQP